MLQDVRECPLPFGSVTTVFGGDFLQTLPVVKHGSKTDILQACLICSPLWSFIEPNILKLEKNMRVSADFEDQQFATWLQDVAKGSLNDETDNVYLPDDLCCLPNTIKCLVQHVYEGMDCPQPEEYFCDRCILCPRNREVHKLNDMVLDKFPGDYKELWSIDTLYDTDTQAKSNIFYPLEVLHSSTPSGFPTAQLKLKISCPVIMLHNLQPNDGVCNGSQGIVTRINRCIVEIRLFTGRIVLVPRIKLLSKDPELPCAFQ